MEKRALKERTGPEASYAAAARLLGIRKSKHAPPRSRMEVHAMLEGGLAGDAVTCLRHTLKVISTGPAFEKALGMSLRSVQRLEGHERTLSPDQSSRAWKLAEIVGRATDVLGSQDAAEDWLSKPARALEGRTPIELLATQPGTQLVEDLLEQMDYGVYV